MRDQGWRQRQAEKESGQPKSEKRPWQRPALRRTSAGEAELSPGAATDGFSNTS